MLSPALYGATYYAAPTGSPGGAGTYASPWDLQTALNSPSVKPGDTIYLMSGTFHGRFSSNLNGTATAPIIVAPNPGSHVRIDGYATTVLTAAMNSAAAGSIGTISVAYVPASQFYWESLLIDGEVVDVNSVVGTTVNVTRGAYSSCPSGTCPSHKMGAAVTEIANTIELRGSYVWLMGIEWTYSGWLSRTTSISGSQPANMEWHTCIDVQLCSYCVVANNTLHDCGNAITGSQNVATVYYGNISYHNGWLYADGAGGGQQHGGSFYVQNDKSTLQQYVTANVVFQDFSVGLKDRGTTQASGAYTTFDNNTVFESGDAAGLGETWNLYLGTNNSTPGIVWSNNTAYDPNGGYNAMYYCTYPVVSNNYIMQGYAGGTALTFDTATCKLDGSKITGNTIWGYVNIQYSVNSYLPARPTGLNIFPRVNAYAKGVETFTVYNWDLAPTVGLDASAILKVGDQYSVLDLQNPLGQPIATGTYSGSQISVTTSLTATPQPIHSSISTSHTGPEFQVYEIINRSVAR